MNPAHLHLIVNHLPVISVLFALGFLILGLLRKRDGLILAGLVISLIVGLTAIPAYLSGEEAEDVVEQWGVADDIVHEHEEKAETAFYIAIVLGILAAGVLITGTKKPALKNGGTWAVLVVALVTAVLMAGTATSGGEIRHPEIHSNAQPSANSEALESDDH